MIGSPLTRLQLQDLAVLRRREAASLLDANHFAGAYYLLGYAVECALKACIARRVPRNTFPRKDTGSLYSHNLVSLRKAAELEDAMDSNAAVQVNWSIVKDWTEQTRYYPIDDERIVRDFYSACTVRTHGVLPWIATKW